MGLRARRHRDVAQRRALPDGTLIPFLKHSERAASSLVAAPLGSAPRDSPSPPAPLVSPFF
eukprot:scaffold250_cov110-Isochrysis_galbana.AAC.1